MNGEALQLMNDVGECFGIELMSSVLNKLSLGDWAGPAPQRSPLQHLVVPDAFRVDEIAWEGQES